MNKLNGYRIEYKKEQTKMLIAVTARRCEMEKVAKLDFQLNMPNISSKQISLKNVPYSGLNFVGNHVQKKLNTIFFKFFSNQ